MTNRKYERCIRALSRFTTGKNTTHRDSIGEHLMRKMAEEQALIQRVNMHEDKRGMRRTLWRPHFAD